MSGARCKQTDGNSHFFRLRLRIAPGPGTNPFSYIPMEPQLNSHPMIDARSETNRVRPDRFTMLFPRGVDLHTSTTNTDLEYTNLEYTNLPEYR